MTAVIRKSIPLTRIQRLIGQRVLESKRTQPCFYLQAKADINELTRIRRPLSRKLGRRISVNDFFIHAIASAVTEYPLMAGRFCGDHIEIADGVNIGFAVAAVRGLVTPVLKDAQSKNLVQISEQMADLIDRARRDKLNLEELEGASVTLTVLGMFEIDSFLAIPSPGQCGIISAGKILEEPVITDGGRAEVRKFIEFGLAADVRIVDYEYAAKFFSRVMDFVTNPEKLTD
ncbi:MAG: 2-oxo acid dehydrogenase subunit E2 [Sedimentisphaerales bacterium]|nr:2-oxo acid dehydrogenase subunit E2 [Sedimentisphaerales bacterium]